MKPLTRLQQCNSVLLLFLLFEVPSAGPFPSPPSPLRAFPNNLQRVSKSIFVQFKNICLLLNLTCTLKSSPK